MRIVIAGAGMIGTHIARELIEEKRDVIVIEKDPEAARIAGNELDCMVINGDESSPEALRNAGAFSADWFIALSGSDEANIVSCGLVSAESGGTRRIARVENPFYSRLSEAQRRALGLDVVLNPAAEAAARVARIVEEGFAEDVAPLHDGRLQLRHVEARAARGFSGRTLSEIKSEAGRAFLVAAAVRKGQFEIPSGDYLVRDGDWLYVLGTPADLDAVLGPVASVSHSAKRILIVGATAVGERLIECLESPSRKRSGFMGMIRGAFNGRRKIALLDLSREAGKRIAKSFQRVEVLSGDSSEEGVLEISGAGESDLVVCATVSQTFNIMTAQLAKTLGAKKSVAITLNDRYAALSAALDVDALVSVKDVMSARILELVRRAHIKTIHGFFEDDVEIVELGVSGDSPAAGKRIMDIQLPKGALAAFVIKGERVEVPSGGTVLDSGDVAAFIVRKAEIGRLERSFGGLRAN